MIKNLRHAQSILKSIAEKNPSYGFYAIANLMEQDVYYEIGKAPDWTSDIALCMTQSIGGNRSYSLRSSVLGDNRG